MLERKIQWQHLTGSGFPWPINSSQSRQLFTSPKCAFIPAAATGDTKWVLFGIFPKLLVLDINSFPSWRYCLENICPVFCQWRQKNIQSFIFWLHSLNTIVIKKFQKMAERNYPFTFHCFWCCFCLCLVGLYYVYWLTVVGGSHSLWLLIVYQYKQTLEGSFHNSLGASLFLCTPPFFRICF